MQQLATGRSDTLIKRLITYALLLLAAVSLCPHAHILAGGVLDGPNVQITGAGLDRGTAEAPHIAVRGNTVYAVWRDTRASATDAHMIYFAKSADGGTSWGPNIRVSEVPFDHRTQTPQIAVQPNGVIWVLWHTLRNDRLAKINDLRLAQSADGGETFQIITFVDGEDDAGDRYRPLITVDGSTGNLYILTHAYQRLDAGEGYDLKLFAFDAEGFSISGAGQQAINDVDRAGRGTFSSTGLRGTPRMSLTARNGVVCAAWEDQRGNFAIFGACSTDGGKTFGSNMNISGPDGVFPRIALAPDGTLYATYTNSNDSRRNIWLRRSNDLGTTWNEPLPVTAQYPDQDEVRDWDLAIDASGQIVMAWIDKDFEFSLNDISDLYLSTSINQGGNFSRIRIEDEQGQFPTTSDQYEVTLAVGGTLPNSRAYLAWRDDRNQGSQLWSQPVVLDGIAPTTPANVTAEAADTSILLRWDASADASGIPGYLIYRAPTGTGPFTRINLRLVENLFYRDVAQSGITWHYQVAAVDGTGNPSLPSSVVSAAGFTGTGVTASGTIAYESGGNIMRLDLPALNNPRTLVQGETPRFSAGGSRLYYYHSGTISSLAIAGGDNRVHLENENVHSIYDLSADETRIGVIIFGQIDGLNCTFVNEPYVFDQGQERYRDHNRIADTLALSADGQ